MTDREQMRANVDRLAERYAELEYTTQRLRARVQALENGAALLRCVYCGAPCRGHVCRAHSDLLGAA